MPSQAGDGKQNTENMEYNEIDPNEDTQSMLRNLTNESKGIYSSKRQRSPDITNNTDNGKKVKNVQSEPTTSSSKSENTKADIWKYSQHDKGPYIFFIKKKERTEKPISILEICRLMKTLCLQYKAISNENNKWTWKVTFDSKYTANLLLTDQRVAEKGYRAFITQELLFRKIVIRDIPTDITKDELEKDLMIDNGRIEIQDIYRLQRKNQKKELVPTESVCVTIRSRELPRDINMWRAKLSFQPYIQSIRQCFKCGKLYYSIKFCTAPEAKCLNCGKQVHGTCQNVSNCINCGGPHKTLDNSCVKVQESKEINKIRAYDNVSYLEAKKMLKKYQNVQDTPMKTNENFPFLKEKTNPNISTNYKPAFSSQTESQWSKSLNINMTNNTLNESDNTNNKDKIYVQEQMKELIQAMKIVPNAETFMSRLWKTLTQHIKLEELLQTENKTNTQDNIINETPINPPTYQKTIPSSELLGPKKIQQQVQQINQE